ANHPHLVSEKEFLVSRTRPRVQTGVIRLGHNSVGFQTRSDVLSTVAALAVDDSALVRPRTNKSQQLFVRTVFWQDAIGEIRTIKAGKVTVRPNTPKLFRAGVHTR